MAENSNNERIARASAEYGPLLDAFIKEVSPFATRESLLSQMEIMPIIFNNERIGIVGIKVEPTKVGKVGIVKLMYLEPRYRKEKLAVMLEQICRRFKQEGITHIEGWSLPGVANWFERELKVSAKLRVYHEEVSTILDRLTELSHKS